MISSGSSSSNCADKMSESIFRYTQAHTLPDSAPVRPDIDPDLWPTSGGGVTVFLQQKRERTVMIMTMVYIISQCFSFYSGFSIISCNSSVVYSKYSIFICISRSGVNYAVCMSTFTLDIIIVLGMSISHLVLNIMIVCSRGKKISLCV